MTRQEAIEYLKLFHGYDLPVQEALDMAIRSLEAWDKIYKEIKTEINPYGKPTKDYETGLWVMNLIKLHLKEVES